MNAVHAHVLAACIALLVACPLARGDPSTDSLVELEKRSWEAWKAQDAAFFREFLADDHVDVGGHGPVKKPAIVGFLASRGCDVKSYSLGDMQVSMLGTGSALLVYRAEQETTCGGKPVPSPTWVTSVYAQRAGRWVNVLFQQTPLTP